MNREKDLILAIIKEFIFRGYKDQILKIILSGQINWLQFKEYVLQHGIVPVCYSYLKNFSELLPNEVKTFLKAGYCYTSANSLYLWKQFLDVRNAFIKKEITILPLKGIAFLDDLYSGRALRSMCDIDVLIKEQDLSRVEEIFYTLGYQKELYGLKEKYWLEKQCHISFYKYNGSMKTLVEVHWGIDFKRKGVVILTELWKRVIEKNINGHAIQLLSSEDTLFSLALHNRRYGNIMNIKNIIDIVLLLKKNKHSFDWDYVLNMCQKYKLFSCVHFALCQAKFLSGSDVPQHVWNRLRVSALKKITIKNFIEKSTFLPTQNNELKDSYLKAHFLLYDDIKEPIDYIVNIPQEQFAKFYGLKAYNRKTSLYYNYRVFYIPIRAILGA